MQTIQEEGELESGNLVPRTSNIKLSNCLSTQWFVDFIATQFGLGRTLVFGSEDKQLFSKLLLKGFDCYFNIRDTTQCTYLNRFFPDRCERAPKLSTASVKKIHLAIIFIDENDGTTQLNDVLELIKTYQIVHTLVIYNSGSNLFYADYCRTRAMLESLAYESGFSKHLSFLEFTHEYTNVLPLQFVFLALSMDIETAHRQDANPKVKTAFAGELKHLISDKDNFLKNSGPSCLMKLWMYQIANEFIRPGDRVLDISTGSKTALQYLKARSKAHSINENIPKPGVPSRSCSIDSPSKVNVNDYLIKLQAQADNHLDLSILFLEVSQIEAKNLDVQNTDFPALLESINFDSMIDETRRTLKPGGRLLLGFYQNHVFDHIALQQIRNHLLTALADKFRLDSGQAINLPEEFNKDEKRLSQDWYFTFRPESQIDKPTNCLLFCFMKDPLSVTDVVYEEQMYAGEQAPDNIISFARDYNNPWLVHALVSLPWRLSSLPLKRLAEDTLAHFSENTIEHAAALCVVGYQLLDNADTDADTVKLHIEKISMTQNSLQDKGHALRWKISNSYLAGLLLSKIGDFPSALHWFEQCSISDCRKFSASLGTKTLSAAYWAGKLALVLGDSEGARLHFQRGVSGYFDLFANGKQEFIGDQLIPFDLPYYEMQEMLYALASCNHALRESYKNPDDILLALNDPKGNVQAEIRNQKDQPHSKGEYRSTEDAVIALLWKIAQSGKEKLIIYGAGNFCKILLKRLQDKPISIVAIVDSNVGLHGGNISDICIYHPNQTPNLLDKETIIAIASKVWAKEIYLQLLITVGEQNAEKILHI